MASPCTCDSGTVSDAEVTRTIAKVAASIRASKTSCAIARRTVRSIPAAAVGSKVVFNDSANEAGLNACSLRSTGVCAAHRPKAMSAGSSAAPQGVSSYTVEAAGTGRRRLTSTPASVSSLSRVPSMLVLTPGRAAARSV